MLEIPHHPSTVLKEEWITILREDAAKAEQLEQLTLRQVDLMLKEKWFLALAPKKYGGLQWSLPETVAFEEAIGWAEGSAGWVFTLCSGAGWFGGFLQPDYAQKIFSQPKACLAGSGAATGTATLLPNGNYLLNGTWKYASGAPHATVFTANTILMESGEEKIIPFCIDAHEVKMAGHWKKMGLIASAGHSFQLDNVEVAPNQRFAIDASFRSIDAPLYKYPFIHLAEATIAANYAGMTIHFMEEWQALIPTKRRRNGSSLEEEKSLKVLFDSLVKEFTLARTTLFATVQKSWSDITNGAEENSSLNSVSEASHALAQQCRDIINQLYPYCGLDICDLSTPINKVWRDFQTGSQHALFQPKI